MVNFRNKRLAGPVALLVSLMLTTMVALVWGSAATQRRARSRGRGGRRAGGQDPGRRAADPSRAATRPAAATSAASSCR